MQSEQAWPTIIILYTPIYSLLYNTVRPVRDNHS